MKHISSACAVIQIIFSFLLVSGPAFSATGDHVPIGKMKRKVLCYEHGDFNICPGSARIYPGFSKVIQGELFGQSVEISYLPVFSTRNAENEEVEYLDDGTYERSEDGAEFHLKRVDVVFDFGEQRTFILPLPTDSELTPTEDICDACDFFPFTDFFETYAEGKLQEELDRRASSSKETEAEPASADDEKNHFAMLDLFEMVDVYSPFHPLSLGVMRYYLNNPVLGNLVFQAVHDVTVDVDAPVKASTYPVRSHKGKNHINLAFFLNAITDTGETFPNNLKPQKMYYIGDAECRVEVGETKMEVEENCRFRGAHYMEYDGNEFTGPSVTKIGQQINHAGASSQKALYGLEVGDIDILPAGVKQIEACTTEILSMAVAHIEKRAAKPVRTHKKRKLQETGSHSVSETTERYEFYGRVLPHRPIQRARTKETALAGWTENIQKQIRPLFAYFSPSKHENITPRLVIASQYSPLELMHPPAFNQDNK